MRLRRLVRFVGLGLLIAAALGPIVRAQTELDRIVSRVNNRIITRSDIRQARMLQLVANAGSDEAVRRELENRMLILTDAARAAPFAPTTAADLAERRRQWESRLGGPSAAAKLLSEAGMSDAALMSWLADDLRIRAYLDRQFATVPESDRSGAVSAWTNRLRQRAGLR
jgi:hypothetical protein